MIKSRSLNQWVLLSLFSILVLSQSGCSTRTRAIGLSMLGGAAVGAGVGYSVVHHGARKQYETRNTIITSAVFALAAGGIAAWHYRSLAEKEIEISGRYARYRLCDPDEMEQEMARQMKMRIEDQEPTIQLSPDMVGRNTIHLDDQTRWVFPDFRKRHLVPTQEDNSVISSRFIWEILRPGHFVTRSQNPEFFYERTQGEDSASEIKGEEK